MVRARCFNGLLRVRRLGFNNGRVTRSLNRFRDELDSLHASAVNAVVDSTRAGRFNDVGTRVWSRAINVVVDSEAASLVADSKEHTAVHRVLLGGREWRCTRQ
mmetsp:Transcript_39628/g.92631  ORF Transcript_39628/g.92631 Transcript_39628/m.92631 type:complete len:103 (+) Transcript_39628:278-586(+)